MTQTERPGNQTDVQKAMKAFVSAVRKLGPVHYQSCVKCGLCGETCHIYLTDPTILNLPVYKAEQIMKIFRRYYTFLGRFLAPWVGAQSLTKDVLESLVETVYGRCTACGRCGLHCSIGFDVSSVIRTGRTMLAEIGKVPSSLQAVVNNQITTGNQMAIPRRELLDTVEWLCQDLRLEMNNDSVIIPVDEPGRRILYLINPREVKFFPLSLLAAAGIFHAAQESWTISSRFYDVTNYGLYSGDDTAAAAITRQVIDEARHLGVEEIVLSECGYGFRSFRWEGPNWLGRAYDISARSMLYLIWDYIDTGKIRIDPSRNPERITLHDPCNLVRWGGVSEPQRKILKRVCMDFQEMMPHGADNYCCGGGGGMLSMSEYGDRRILSGSLKAEQIRASGARIVAAPCHNCADQLLELNKKFKLGVEIQSVTEIVYNAMVLEMAEQSEISNSDADDSFNVTPSV
ncbi:(Fe-S)-binding protein [bacterium]|nr:(Fe-S)-binding protein [candidate division CSSED10-310 bacterium]